MSLAEMRARLLATLAINDQPPRDRRKGRYPIGLTDWDEAIDGDEPGPRTVPTCLTEEIE